MEPIPFNVPGLPELEELSDQWVLQPVTVDPGAPDSGPLLGLPTGLARGSATPADGVLCLYPGIQTVAYLFQSALQLRQGNPIPAIVLTTHAADGLCAIFAFSEDGDGNPLLIVNILSADLLPAISKSSGDSSVINLAGIEDRIEITQTFGANAFGIVSRLSNKLTRVPDDSDNTIFELYNDPGSIADVCAFYMSRALELSSQAPATGADVQGGTGIPTPFYRLLWKPPRAAGLASLGALYILYNLRISYRRATGDSYLSIEFNTPANQRGRGGGGNAE